MIEIREARESDLDRICEIFRLTYGGAYAHSEYYDPQQLKRMLFDDNTVLLVAEDTANKAILGTASVLLEIGSHEDLLGEFGRLAVDPQARNCGLGRRLMQGRLERVSDRLHVGIVDNRVAHPYSQKISLEYKFVPVGFLPLKFLLNKRESLAVHVRHFGDALSLRRNNPRIIPEAHRLAELALRHCSLPCDVIVDDEANPYPHEVFRLDELKTEGYTTLLRFERGRVRNREIFGPMRLHYGLFKLRARHSNYLLACDDKVVVGGLGFTLDEIEKAARIFELVATDEAPVRFLLQSLSQKCEERGVEYIEVDVSAYAPRMQRTLLELHYLPAAYVPAMIFYDVERLDTIRMVRLLVPPEIGQVELTPQGRLIADVVMRNFATRSVLPRIAKAVLDIRLFSGLTDEQRRRVASACGVRAYAPGETILTQGENERKTYLVLEGEVRVFMGSPPREVGTVRPGESVGDMSLLSDLPYPATATAKGPVETAVLDHTSFRELIRLRPDIGIVIYHNFAKEAAEKLHRMDLFGK
ncbi:MAG: GNAT family N-acetyltransferase [Alphaproteobacteria bacterium]